MTMQTSRLLDAAERLGEYHPHVVATEIVADATQYDQTVLEVTVAPHCEYVPPSVLNKLAEYDCGVVDVTPRGDPTHFVITAV